MDRESILRRYRRLLGADPRRDVDEEIAFHVAMREEEFRNAGMSQAEAEEATMKRFGDMNEIRAEVSDLAVRRQQRRRRAWQFDAVRQDVRFALRTLAANPLYAAIVTLTLAIGIGANTAVFSVAYGVLMRPLPYADAERLVRLWSRNDRANLPFFSVSAPDFKDWRANTRTLASVAAYERQRPATLQQGDQPRAVSIAGAMPEIFSVLGASPMLGRALVAGDAQAGAPPVTVMSHAMWTTMFGSDSSIIGRAISVDAKSYTVVGVMPPRWMLPANDATLWTPLSLDVGHEQRGDRFLRVIGRMKPGILTSMMLAELQAVAARSARDGTLGSAGWSVNGMPLIENLVGAPFRRAVLLLLGVVALVLLISCANVANLLLARAAARHREFSVRAAIGASRGRIVRQLLTETLIVSCIAGALGLALGYAGIAVLRMLGAATVPRLEDVKLDAPVLLFTALVALGSGVVFGLLPALRVTRADIGDVLKQRTSSTHVSSRLRGSLVVAEIALSLVLLIAAGLLTRAFARLSSTNLGFRPEGVLVSNIRVGSPQYRTPESASAFMAGVLTRAGSVPGVESVALVSSPPFGGPNTGSVFAPADRPVPPAAEIGSADLRFVSAGYFRTVGIRLVRGRDIAPTDGPGAPLVAIISASLAKQFWPNDDAVGKQFRGPTGDPASGRVVTVIGVVDDARYMSLSPSEDRPMFYLSWYAFPRSMTLVAHTTSAAADASLRGAINSLDRRLPPMPVASLSEMVSQASATPRFALSLFGIFAAIALLLALVGLYGVLSYLVRQRSHELGIRVALGAPRTSLITMIVGNALRLTIGGIMLGILGSYIVTRSLGSLLYDVSPTDALTFVGLSLLLALAAVAASLGPALRATRVDPLVALRMD